jgi:hypothetical protein
MNQPDRDKRKFTYYEHNGVFATLQLIAKDETSTRGRIVRASELIRNMTRARANEYHRKHGQPRIKYDTTSGKFAPSSVDSATLALVTINGDLKVFDKQGKKMNNWRKVTQLPDLLRLHPKCKVCPAMRIASESLLIAG